MCHHVNSYGYGRLRSASLLPIVVSFFAGGWGYYTDEGSRDVLIRDNISFRTKCAGFHQHYVRLSCFGGR